MPPGPFTLLADMVPGLHRIEWARVRTLGSVLRKKDRKDEESTHARCQQNIGLSISDGTFVVSEPRKRLVG